MTRRRRHLFQINSWLVDLCRGLCPALYFEGSLHHPCPSIMGMSWLLLKLIMKHPKKSSPEARLQTLPPWSCTWNHTPRVLELCFSPSAKTHMLHGICSHRHFSGTGWWVHQVIVSSPWIVYWPRQLHRNGKSDAENKNIWRNPPFWKQKICYKSSETEYGFFMGMFSQLNLHTFIFFVFPGKWRPVELLFCSDPLPLGPGDPTGDEAFDAPRAPRRNQPKTSRYLGNVGNVMCQIYSNMAPGTGPPPKKSNLG